MSRSGHILGISAEGSLRQSGRYREMRKPKMILEGVLTVENWAELEKVLQGAFIFRKKNAVEQRLLEI